MHLKVSYQSTVMTNRSIEGRWRRKKHRSVIIWKKDRVSEHTCSLQSKRERERKEDREEERERGERDNSRAKWRERKRRSNTK